jgi:hypothetical protein
MACYPIPISQAQMQNDYYHINPPRHAECAYQPNQGDKFPPVSTVPTTCGPSGVALVMVTTLRNATAGGQGQAEVIDYNSLKKFNNGVFPTPEQADRIIKAHPEIVAGNCSYMMPFIGQVYCEPNSLITVRPLVGGTQAKVVSCEDYGALGGDPPFTCIAR